ncbi:hypothetical protein [Breoghania sp. L-A4]|uniref:hypothetical protein n=1 Tax=Breoghania sp. L-A4 TaxID=2304600 RepID=UPI0013C370EA|nr:hypothetical protein [Breoghania sp. L-A4]
MMGNRLASAAIAVTMLGAHLAAPGWWPADTVAPFAGVSAARAASVDIQELLERAARDPARVLKLLEDDRSFPGGRSHYEAKIEGLVDVILEAPPNSSEVAVAARILGSLEHPWETNRPDLAARRLNVLVETGNVEARNDFARALANRSGLYLDASGQDFTDPQGYIKAIAGYAEMARFSQTPHALVSALRLGLLLAGCQYTAACDPEIASQTAGLPGTAGQTPGEQALALLRDLAPLDPKSPAFRLSPGHWRWRNDAAFTLGLAQVYAGDTGGARETFNTLRDWPVQLDAYAHDMMDDAAMELRRSEPDYRDQVFVWSVLPGRALVHNRHFAAETVGQHALGALDRTESEDPKRIDIFIETFDRIENTDNTIIFGSFRSRTQAQNFMDAYQPLLDSSRRSFNGSLPDLMLEVGAPQSGSAWYSVRTHTSLSDSDVQTVLEALRDTPAFQKIQPYTDRPRVQ